MIRFTSLGWLVCSAVDEIMTLRNYLLHTLRTMNLFLVTLGLNFFFYFLWLPFESRLFTAHFSLFDFLLWSKSLTFPRRSASMVTFIVWLIDFYWLSCWVHRFRSIIETLRIAALQQIISISYFRYLRINKILSFCYCLKFTWVFEVLLAWLWHWSIQI